LEKEDDPLFVAEVKGEIIGFVLCQVHNPTRKATIENIVVKEEYRQKGIASMLLQKCLDDLKKLGPVYICALTKINNEATLNFMIKHGFRRGYEFVWLEL
jgi:ribosomal protein S18 acetylase RimI-like enzyme